MARFLSTNSAALKLGVESWKLHKVFTDKIVAEPARVGRSRVIAEADLPKLRRALVGLGFLPESASA